ncbi:MAG: biotin--[acetyl-CoA-carboxylase] ligase [Pseudomonadota bacterium]
MIESAPVYWYDDIDSTSEEAKRRAKRGELSAVWIAARSQSAGKGRLGRSWESPQGNLFSTLLFPEPDGLTFAARIPFAAALAVRDACVRSVPSIEAKLKWPNDVRVRGQKMSGILTESGETNGILWIALGIGINVATAPEGTGQETSSLMKEGAPPGITPDMVLADLRAALAIRLNQARQGFDGLLTDWVRYAEGVGQTVQAGPSHNRIEGIFESLATDGGLNLRLPNGALHTIRAGDVELVKRIG